MDPEPFLPDSDPVLSRLRERPLPEAPAWFAAATVARLRREGRVVRPGLGDAFRELAVRLAGSLRRRAASLALAALVVAALGGWQWKAARDSQQLTFAALELVAQGQETPFPDEEAPAWPDASY